MSCSRHEQLVNRKKFVTEFDLEEVVPNSAAKKEKLNQTAEKLLEEKRKYLEDMEKMAESTIS